MKKNTIIHHGPNYLSIDGTYAAGGVRIRAAQIGMNRVGSNIVAIVAEATDANEPTWAEIRMTQEDAVRLANEILKAAG